MIGVISVLLHLHRCHKSRWISKNECSVPNDTVMEKNKYICIFSITVKECPAVPIFRLLEAHWLCVWALAAPGQRSALGAGQTWAAGGWGWWGCAHQAAQLHAWSWLIPAHPRLQAETASISLQMSSSALWPSPRGSFPVNFDTCSCP